jgi:hypothetical protein
LLSDRSTFTIPSTSLDGRAPKGLGFTNIAGLYVLYSKTTKKIYIGFSYDLSQRKGEHANSIKNLSDKESKAIIADVKALSLNVSDFEFFVIKQVDSNLADNITATGNPNINAEAQISNFLEQVEHAILTDFFTDPLIKQRLYNVKTTSEFTKGNPGGLPGKGSSKPVAWNDFAWESKTKAESCFELGRKQIGKNAKDQKRGWRDVSKEEFDNWDPSKKNVNLKKNGDKS